jgi:hypothetical protein
VFEAFVVAAALTVVDPVGDVVGAGSLQPPTAPVYRSLAPFDLHRVTVRDDEQLTLVIEMGSLANPFELPLGFSLPVIEIYLDAGSGGQTELLAGSGMRLPSGHAWDLAVRLTGEEALAYQAGESGVDSVVPVVTIDGNQIEVRTPFGRPEHPRLYAMVGLYDLFGASPWRPLDRNESPWAFSSAEQTVPVVDVLAADAAAQRQALETGTIVPAGSRRAVPGRVWLVLMALGLLLALLGIAMRTLARPPPARQAETGESGPAGMNDRSAEASLSDRNAAEPLVREPRDEWPVTSAARNGARAGSNAAGMPEEPDSELRWDSSALLTSPDDDDFSEEFPAPRGRLETGEAWARPVPLPLEEEREAVPADEDGAEPELVTDDEAASEVEERSERERRD